MNNVKVGQDSLFRVSNDGLVVMGKRIYLPNDEVLKGEVLKEAHETKLVIHPGSTKMYRDLKESYWWPKCIEISNITNNGEVGTCPAAQTLFGFQLVS